MQKSKTGKKRGRKQGNGLYLRTIKLKDGRKAIVYYANFVHLGKRYFFSLGTDDREKAEKELTKKKNEIFKGEERTQQQALKYARTERDRIDKAISELTEGGIPLAGVFDSWIEDRQSGGDPLADSTIATNRSRWNAFINWLQSRKPDVENIKQVDEAIAKEYLDFAGKGKTLKTKNDIRSTFLVVWRWLIKKEKTEENPWAATEWETQARLQQATHDAFRDDELDALFCAAEGELRLLLQIGASIGQRLKDCVLLKWGQVDFSHNLISMTPFKTAKYFKRVPIRISDQLRGWLGEAWSKAGVISDDDYIMPGLALRYLHQPRSVVKQIQRTIKAAGFTTNEGRRVGRSVCLRGFHSLRHYFAQNARDNGVSQEAIADALGHSSKITTGIYNTISNKERKQEMAKIPWIPTPRLDALTAGRTLPAIPEKADGAGAAVAADSPAMRAFRAAVNSMTAEERETARKILAGLA